MAHAFYIFIAWSICEDYRGAGFTFQTVYKVKAKTNCLFTISYMSPTKMVTYSKHIPCFTCKNTMNTWNKALHYKAWSDILHTLSLTAKFCRFKLMYLQVATCHLQCTETLFHNADNVSGSLLLVAIYSIFNHFTSHSSLLRKLINPWWNSLGLSM